MSRLTSKQRKALPKSDFAGPGRSFPIPDEAHARAALMLVNKAPASARPAIRAKARRMLDGAGGPFADHHNATEV
jgi:hypothetical protein